MDASDDVVSRMIVYFHMKRFPRMQLVCDSTRMYYKRHIQFSYLFYKLFVTSFWYLAAILLVIIQDLKSWIKKRLIIFVLSSISPEMQNTTSMHILKKFIARCSMNLFIYFLYFFLLLILSVQLFNLY